MPKIESKTNIEYENNLDSAFNQKNTNKTTKLKEIFSKNIKPPTLSDLAQDFNQLSIILKANLTLKEALSCMANTNPALDKTYKEIIYKLEKGKKVEGVFKGYENIFTPLGVALLDSGARGSNLGEMFEVLGNYFKESSEFNAKFKKALFYPAFVLFSAIAACIMVAVFVMPEFGAIFNSLGNELPFATKSLMFISNITINYGVYIAFGVCALVLVFILFYKLIFHNLVDYVLLKAPLISQVIIAKEFWAYFVSFYYLYKAKLDFKVIFEITESNLHNKIILKQITKSQNLILDGKDLGDAFRDLDLLDSSVKNFLNTAKISGTSEQMLELSFKYYKEIYRNNLEKILRYLEPFSSIVLAIVVGYLALGIFIPIWDLGSMGFE